MGCSAGVTNRQKSWTYLIVKTSAIDILTVCVTSITVKVAMGESLRIRRWQWGFYCVVAMLTVLPPMTHGDRYQTFSMECGGTVELGDTEAGYVSYSYDPGQDCTVTFTGASGKKFLLHFVTLDMGPDDSCDDQELRIYDGEQASGDLLASVCGSEQEGLDVTTSTNFVTLRLTSGDSASGDLRIKYTMFYDSAGDVCRESDDFRCDDGKCIRSELRQDGYCNCPGGVDEPDGCEAEGEDVSDSAEAEPEGEPESEPEAEPESEPEPESEWIPELGMTMWALTGIIIGTVAFLIFTGVAAYFAVKHFKKGSVGGRPGPTTSIPMGQPPAYSAQSKTGQTPISA
ncbi:uncharacterized protein LOC118428397 [Branchiostoma floridae]|uniref:Uncharacterized protein LOC118428397 n=1 Tax=Branchiostoma floridae TaxID=7739 RepID=A0A9J7M4I8_BRAFL|nr:uncharacterized protein LOC118428397 [Branchiostoma floridae]